MPLSVIILAAGQGTRMRSNKPKVLHELADKPLLSHVIETVQALKADALYVVYGHAGEQVRAMITDETVQWIEQTERLGTGHAVLQAMPDIPDDHRVLVLYGDVPLTRLETLQPLCAADMQSLGLLTVTLDNPFGYGRIVRTDNQAVVCITEQKDADVATQKIKEVNTGILSAPAQQLRQWLNALSNDNAQGEYYLTDIVGMAVETGIEIDTFSPSCSEEVAGVNDRVQLARLERVYQAWQADILMRGGVTLRDPARIDVRGHLSIGQDSRIDVNVVFMGDVTIGERVEIAANCVISDSVIADDVVIHAHSMIDQTIIEVQCQVGPFARLRPQTHLCAGAKVGNFVEVKKSTIGEGSKVSHLSYIGDTEMGQNVNIGAGTITCNYDGANKYQTHIGDGAFIGSDTQLIAPVSVGAGATIGAGSTITRNTPEGELTLSRAKQHTVVGWQRPVKK